MEIRRLEQRDPLNPSLEALKAVCSELQLLRQDLVASGLDVTALGAQTRILQKEVQFLRDDVRELATNTRHIPVIKDMLAEVLSRLGD